MLGKHFTRRRRRGSVGDVISFFFRAVSLNFSRTSATIDFCKLIYRQTSTKMPKDGARIYRPIAFPTFWVCQTSTMPRDSESSRQRATENPPTGFICYLDLDTGFDHNIKLSSRRGLAKKSLVVWGICHWIITGWSLLEATEARGNTANAGFHPAPRHNTRAWISFW